MTDIQKPDMSKQWANAGDKTPPADSLINAGWISGDIPTNTDFNFIDARQDQGVAYILQKGIPEWDSATEYQAGKSWVQYGGRVYKAIQTGVNKQPDTQVSFWADYFVPQQELTSSTGAGLVGIALPFSGEQSLTSSVISSIATVRPEWYQSLVTVKPNPSDPSTWDWSPALAAAHSIEGATIDLAGRTYRAASDFTVTANSTKTINGGIVLDGCFMYIRNKANNKFSLVEFSGVRNLPTSDFTGVFLGAVASAPTTFNNGDGYINLTTLRPYIAKSGVWTPCYKESGVVIDSTGSNVTTGQNFVGCEFRLFSEAILYNADRDTTANLRIGAGCVFQSNAVGLRVIDPKRVLVTGGVVFTNNAFGAVSDTAGYVGLGLNFVGNYFNGNYAGMWIRNGLYDSTFSVNEFDHNSYFEMFGGDVSGGWGVKFSSGSGRIYRSINMIGNPCRNNGAYSIIIDHTHATGEFAYCNISNNTGHLDDTANILINDQSTGGSAFYLNVFGNNNFQNGFTTQGNFNSANNAIHSIYQGGNIRGKTDFNTGIALLPSNNLFTTTEGYTQYSTPLQGFTVVAKRYNGTLLQQRVQLADYATSAEIAALSRTPRVGEMIYNVTLNKPLWKSATGWVDANGTAVTL